LYYNRRLYSFQNGGIVFCRVTKAGEWLYSGQLGAPGYYYSSPVAADKKVYIASEEGVVAMLRNVSLTLRHLGETFRLQEEARRPIPTPAAGG
jgi:hypothetical protein